MFNSNNTPFTMPVMPATGGYADGGAWGEGGWLWILVVFALLFGWGNNGLGGFGGNNGGGYVATAATQADIQRGFDNSAVISKLDGISNGLCDGFYAMNNSMLTGFNGINTNIMQTGYGIQQAINADTVANMQNTNALQSQLANCCCETREAIQGVNYNMATIKVSHHDRSGVLHLLLYEFVATVVIAFDVLIKDITIMLFNGFLHVLCAQIFH